MNIRALFIAEPEPPPKNEPTAWTAGSAIMQGTQFGTGTLLLRYSRDFEKQADLMGVQIMARAGYDPR